MKYKWASLHPYNIIPASAFYFGAGVGKLVGDVVRVPVAFCIGVVTMIASEVRNTEYNPLNDTKK